MAYENVAAPAAGTVLPFDNVGGNRFPRAKQAWGVEGATTDVADTSGARLPVKMGEGLGATVVVQGRHTAATGTATALPSAVARRFRIRSINANTATIDIGTAGVLLGAGMPLDPGDWYPHALEISNLNIIRAISSVAGQVLAYFGEV